MLVTRSLCLLRKSLPQTMHSMRGSEWQRRCDASCDAAATSSSARRTLSHKTTKTLASTVILPFQNKYFCQKTRKLLDSRRSRMMPEACLLLFCYEFLVDSTLATRRTGEQKFSYLQFASSAHSFFSNHGSAHNVASEVMEPFLCFCTNSVFISMIL